MSSLSFAMDTADANRDALEQKKAALQLLMDMLSDGDEAGIDPDCMAQACLFTGLKEFVDAYGEEAVAKFAERLPERIRNGEFSLARHS
jgi:hypothetical protein